MKKNYKALKFLSIAQICLLMLFASTTVNAQEISGESGGEPVIDVIHGISDYQNVSTTRGELTSTPAVELIDHLVKDEDSRNSEDDDDTDRLDLDDVQDGDRYLDGDLADYGLGYGDSWIAYPNPSKGMLNLEFKDDSDRTIVIFNMIGQAVYQFESIEQANLQIDLSDLHNGMYIIQVMRGEQLTTKRIELSH